MLPHQTMHPLANFAGDYPSFMIGNGLLVNADCFVWLKSIPENSICGVVTDPPYGVKEYEADQLEKRTAGKGGIWRIPPSFDGHERAPLPRFTALNPKERVELQRFFRSWAALIMRVLRPGGHLLIATNAFISQLTLSALVEGGMEYRGEIIRLVSTLRGGDKPKGAEEEFPDVCSLPRGGYEPWGLLRKPMPAGMTVSECLRLYQTGGLRRQENGDQFSDVIPSERTSKAERALANHPSLKPQSLLRQLVYAALPLGEGIILDPFMGSGSTIAACEAMGLSSIGIERQGDYYEEAKAAIPRLALLRDNRAQPAQSQLFSLV